MSRLLVCGSLSLSGGVAVISLCLVVVFLCVAAVCPHVADAVVFRLASLHPFSVRRQRVCVRTSWGMLAAHGCTALARSAAVPSWLLLVVLSCGFAIMFGCVPCTVVSQGRVSGVLGISNAHGHMRGGGRQGGHDPGHWTVAGLWPGAYLGTWATNCNRSSGLYKLAGLIDSTLHKKGGSTHVMFKPNSRLNRLINHDNRFRGVPGAGSLRDGSGSIQGSIRTNCHRDRSSGGQRKIKITTLYQHVVPRALGPS